MNRIDNIEFNVGDIDREVHPAGRQRPGRRVSSRLATPRLR